jgi:hypothetical protein|tara:strand:- start:3760 stop:4296 length:537 start_codon:yes stop_codon:yes gene_type:complete
MSKIYFLILIFSLFLNSCGTIRESAGVTRKSIDEFKVVENPPLVIPPDFNLLPPEQLEERNIDNIEKDLAQEILFGLDENLEENIEEITTMNQILLQADAVDDNASIRNQIDEDFANEFKSNKIFNMNWEDEVDVLDAVKESERIRNQTFDGKSIADGETPIKKEVITKKKKKRFIFF